MSLFHIKLGLQINVGLLVSQNFFLSPPMDAVGGDLYNWGPTYLYIGLIRFWFDIIQFGLTSHVRGLHPSYPATCGRVSLWVALSRHTCWDLSVFFIGIILMLCCRVYCKWSFDVRCDRLQLNLQSVDLWSFAVCNQPAENGDD